MSAELLQGLTLTGLKFGETFSKSKSMPKENSTPEPLTTVQEPLTAVVESTIEEVSIAIETADSLARRSGRTVVIQEDLSVVYKKDATKRILETVRSF